MFEVRNVRHMDTPSLLRVRPLSPLTIAFRDRVRIGLFVPLAVTPLQTGRRWHVPSRGSSTAQSLG